MNTDDKLKPLEVIVKYCPACKELNTMIYLEGSKENGDALYNCTSCYSTRSFDSILSYDAMRRTQNFRRWK